MIEMLLSVVALYLAIGLLVATFLQLKGLAKLDPAAAHAPWRFRLLITPGLVALWPVMLRKAKPAAGGADATGAAEAPVSPRSLRASHLVLVLVIVLGLPAAFFAALWSRGPAPPVARTEVFPPAEPLAEVLAGPDPAFGELPIRLSVRGEGSRRQLELEVSADLEQPSIVGYWMPAGSGQGPPLEGLFLGPVWGPATQRFELQGAAKGTLVLHSLALDHEIGAAVIDVP